MVSAKKSSLGVEAAESTKRLNESEMSGRASQARERYRPPDGAREFPSSKFQENASFTLPSTIWLEISVGAPCVPYLKTRFCEKSGISVISEGCDASKPEVTCPDPTRSATIRSGDPLPGMSRLSDFTTIDCSRRCMLAAALASA